MISRCAVLGVSVALGGAAICHAADPASSARTVRIAASERYEAHRLHRFTFGGSYRDLWKTPIEVPILDLQKEGGGLVPTARFGGNQTPVLAFEGRDGRDYTFRSIDKNPAAVLHPYLRQTFVRNVIQDQMAAQHPTAALVADYITRAAGVLTQTERLVVMPDDPALGSFREDFAGMLGTFYEFQQPVSHTNPGYRGTVDIIGHEELYDSLETDPAVRVDARAFLRARLVDILLGDFDRHRKQWRWAKFPDEPLWQPIAEDRDMAFVRYEGIGPRLGHLYVPILQRYGPKYDDIYGLTLHGWEQDRWLLSGLDWPAWEQAASEIQDRITDSVIDDAIAELPPEYVKLDGARLAADLRGRRDRLQEGARKFYRHLAKKVDVHATDATEWVRVERDAEGGLSLEVSTLLDPSAQPETTFQRRFLDDDTKEVRLYLRAGEDRVVVGGGRGPITLRVIAGGGAGEVDDRAGGGTRIYDSEQTYTVLPGPRTHVNHRPYAPPEPTAARYLEAERIPPRDWGYDWYPIPQLGYEKDVGFFLGGSVVLKTYGFRSHPWKTMHVLSGGWAFGASKPRVAYQGAYQRESSKLVAKLDTSYSGIEILGFYGFGNDTTDVGSDSSFRVRDEEFRFAPGVELPLWIDELRLAVGPFLQYSNTEGGDRLIDEIDPYGAGRFGMVGGQARLRFDTRRSVPNVSRAPELRLGPGNPAATYPTTGIFVDVRTQVSPKLWDVERWWGSIGGSVSCFASVGDNARLTLAVRGGGEHVFGTFPYMGAAYLGGGGTVSGEGTIRGYRPQRFAGDQMLFGNLDARLFLARVKLILPGDLGVLGFADGGRVFLDGEDSRDWHTSAGGGIWFAPLVRTNVFSVTVANSEEDTLVYFRSGFHF